MNRNAPRILLLALSAALLFGVTGVAQDFQRTYKIAPEGSIRIATISGDVRVQGYDGSEVVAEGFRVGRDRERVEILDRSGTDHVDLGVHYQPGNGDASINFVVKVPRSVSYNFADIRSVSGSVHLSDVTGHVSARSVSGSVEIKNVTGIVSADSTSGNVDVVLRQIEGTGDMRFSSISGSVAVKAPANLNAYVSMSTLSGTLTTDFPIDIQERRYAPGRSARGRLGTGACSIRITSVSGRVSLTKG
ncbi:MAG: DUF4097 family beta strand repeat-containing protein [Acidobacteriota bacterium]|jgi:DUF4097 and DUF4098 domain-containing protein YvlB